MCALFQSESCNITLYDVLPYVPWYRGTTRYNVMSQLSMYTYTIGTMGVPGTIVPGMAYPMFVPIQCSLELRHTQYGVRTYVL
jgi:hypothetical protein